MLTRNFLESRGLQPAFQAIKTQLPAKVHVATEVELQASLQKTLRQHHPEADLWLFGYGSLIWNPCFNFVEQRVGVLQGWHRSFCLESYLMRGTPEHPGLVMGLESGGYCQGVAFRIPAEHVFAELMLLWQREMSTFIYIPCWVNICDGSTTLTALTFMSNPDHPFYTGPLAMAEIIERLATAHGLLGSAADYLFQTVEGLARLELRDPDLLELRKRVLARQRSLFTHTSVNTTRLLRFAPPLALEPGRRVVNVKGRAIKSQALTEVSKALPT